MRVRAALLGFVAAIVVCAAAFLYLRQDRAAGPGWSSPTRIVSMPTNGGQLETATVTVWETLDQESPGKYRLPGGVTIDLGTTYSRVRFMAVYRYHLNMASVWSLELRPDKTCLVRTSPLQPTLPVAFESNTFEAFTVSGWARFDKHDNLLALQKNISPELAKRASEHLGAAMEVGRPVLAKWVSDWLLKYEKDGGKYRVIILYPGEQAPAVSSL